MCSGEVGVELGNRKEIKKRSMCHSNFYIESNIDFNIPGVYEVFIYVSYKNPINVKFAVQVIDEEFFENAKP